MADTTWKASTTAKSTATLASATEFRVIDDPAGTPTSKKTTIGAIKTYINGLANTWSAAQTVSVAGAASTPALYLTGAVLTGGTGTTNFPHIFYQPAGATASTTWSTAGTAFGANMATGFAGNFFDFAVAGTSTLKANSTTLTVPAGTSSVVGLRFNGALSTNTGFYDPDTQRIACAIGGTFTSVFSAQGVMVSNASLLGWGSTATANADVCLLRDAANTLALRNSTTAQAFNVYNTYTDASNYERLSLAWSSNVMQLTTNVLGTGTARALSLGVGATGQWQINTSGHLVATTDNTYDIGASGANRPRNVYVAGSVVGGGNIYFSNTGVLTTTSRGAIGFSADGVLYLYDNSFTSFGRLCFGGTTSSFPALKRSSTVLQARLADDSGFAPLQGNLRTQANAVAETPTATHTMIITDAGGTAYRVLCVV